MVQLYVSDSVSRISFADGRVIVWSEELGESQYPIETLDGITLFGRPTMNRPGMSGDSSSWKGWGHVRWFIEEVPAGAA